MKKFGFLKNKYSVSALILLGCLGTDIILHKGMSRVIIPEGFTNKIEPSHLPACHQPLTVKGKHWVQAVNDTELIKKLLPGTPGIECDIYFNAEKNCFEVYHDSSALSSLNADVLLSGWKTKDPDANVWFDFKNLKPENLIASLVEMKRLRDKYQLEGKIIIESPEASLLKSFCDNGFFTSYYVPFFNPYRINEEELIQLIDTIKNNLAAYPSSSLSGYYFQYPVLKKFFPNYPILTWSENPGPSLVSNYFHNQLKNDSMIKVVLTPFNE